MMATSSLVFFLASLIAVNAGNVPIKSCGKGATDIVKGFRVSECEAGKCELVKGKTYKIEIDFVPPKTANNVVISAHAVIGSIEVKWPGMKTEVCGQFNIKCPLEGDQKQTYINDVLVDPSYPAINVPVHWKILLDGKLAACLAIDAKIKNA